MSNGVLRRDGWQLCAGKFLCVPDFKTFTEQRDLLFFLQNPSSLYVFSKWRFQVFQIYLKLWKLLVCECPWLTSSPPDPWSESCKRLHTSTAFRICIKQICPNVSSWDRGGPGGKSADSSMSSGLLLLRPSQERILKHQKGLMIGIGMKWKNAACALYAEWHVWNSVRTLSTWTLTVPANLGSFWGSV